MSKKQIVTVQIDDANVNTGWSSASLRVQEYRSGTIGPFKEAVIRIREPSDVSYLREKLDQIEQYWADQLKRYSEKQNNCVTGDK